MPTISEISSLLETLTSSIDVFKAELTRQQLPEPSLSTSLPHAIDDPAYVSSPLLYEARRLAISSLASTSVILCLGSVLICLFKNQLRLLLESPLEAVINTSSGSLEIQGLRLTTEIGLPEILDAAADPEEGENIRVIAERTKTDEGKLEGILRYVVKRGWFRETKPGYFSNNRRSCTLHNGRHGYHLIKNFIDYAYGVHGKLPELMTHPDESFRMARDPTHTAWNIYANTDLPFFGPNGWLEKYPIEAQKFALGMGCLGVASNGGVIYDFPWVEFCKGKDAIIDVGGGQGSLSCALAAAYPEIRPFVVQDLPGARESAHKFITSQGVSDRVKFEEQNFFEPNRRKGTGNYVFILQRILHDWSIEEGTKILRRIRDCLVDSKVWAATVVACDDDNDYGPSSQSTLVIIDPLLSPATFTAEAPSAKDSLSALKGKSQYQPVPSPPFIPQDFGDNWLIAHGTNASLIALYNTFEHTYSSMTHMLELVGMKIKRVNATRGSVQVMEIEIS
ncbi:S-adenosyl-L-methionine-dependent methyltransferase [Neolentinus lepideus HHB14362 ss-1]|uniref:S-adenosyl-L-methionine-dependent methyltransferase n=1 Tax=Neolentinus lepideus HHB14362 ss-1 TaxID=1314782 RepID=A0A165QDL7_9AGAM|nr:S-adenosyl-L-methionine-dependent methyltransferase [Neolentinus lepideus HHB14362 ss-1]